MRIAVIQFQTNTVDNMDVRFAQLLTMLPPKNSCDLVILPELWLQGAFEFSNFSPLMLSGIQIKLDTLSDKAKENGYWIHAGSYLITEDSRMFNEAIIFDNLGKSKSKYRKNYVFGFGEGEAKLVSAGSDFEVIESPWGRIGLAICYDLRFPEHFRKINLNGAEIFLVCAAWPKKRINHWTTLLIARAIENQSLVIGCNGTGNQTDANLGGNSMIIGPDGEVLLDLGDEQGVFYLDFDTKVISDQRELFPVLKDIK